MPWHLKTWNGTYVNTILPSFLHSLAHTRAPAHTFAWDTFDISSFHILLWTNNEHQLGTIIWCESFTRLMWSFWNRINQCNYGNKQQEWSDTSFTFGRGVQRTIKYNFTLSIIVSLTSHHRHRIPLLSISFIPSQMFSCT